MVLGLTVGLIVAAMAAAGFIGVRFQLARLSRVHDGEIPPGAARSLALLVVAAVIFVAGEAAAFTLLPWPLAVVVSGLLASAAALAAQRYRRLRRTGGADSKLSRTTIAITAALLVLGLVLIVVGLVFVRD